MHLNKIVHIVIQIYPDPILLECHEAVGTPTNHREGLQFHFSLWVLMCVCSKVSELIGRACAKDGATLEAAFPDLV